MFQLYCVEELTIPQTARKCRCSLGTVANRLNLLRARTGVAPERLRGISAYFTKYEEDFRQAQRNYRRGTASEAARKKGFAGANVGVFHDCLRRPDRLHILAPLKSRLMQLPRSKSRPDPFVFVGFP